MFSILRLPWFFSVVFWVALATARPELPPLIERLRNAEDFRLRVQAALQLGKSEEPRARPELERALGDRHASVRAAAAAALGALGDPRSVPALKKRRSDASVAVKKSAERAIATIQARQARKRAIARAKLVVRLGRLRVVGARDSARATRELVECSRAKLGELPGVVVLADGEEPAGNVPVVMVTGALHRAVTPGSSSGATVSARVDYVLHRMPEQDIAGTVTGSAKAKAARDEMQSSRRDAELTSMVLEAAVESAMRRASEALLAAAR